ncbi:MAG: hypothetical protein NT115_12150 [Proteobacteria bacterium]|nr:hypothetical protein [Pseudomonadota bacterium]
MRQPPPPKQVRKKKENTKTNRNNSSVKALTETLHITKWEALYREIDKSVESPPASEEGYAEFALDFENALAHQLGPFFEKLKPAKLHPDTLKEIVHGARGAYYLLLNDELVYIGKSDAKAGLKARLHRHYDTLRCRRGIDFEQMKFKAVKIFSFSAIDTESLLLDIFSKLKKINGVKKARPAWNLSGFGSNDPGKERDTQKVSVFDQRHPLDLDAKISFDLNRHPLPEGPQTTLLVYLTWLAKHLPFTFRTDKKQLKKLGDVSVTPSALFKDQTLRQLLLKIHSKLPANWTLTVLRGKVVLYENEDAKYKSPVWVLIGKQAAGQPTYELGDVGIDDDETEDGENNK